MHPLSRRLFLGTTFSSATLACLNRRLQANEVSWLEEIQTRPDDLSAAEETKLSSLLQNIDGKSIRSRDDWEKQKKHLRKIWLDFLQPLNLPHPKPKIKILEEDQNADCIRQLVRYESEPGLAVEGYLLKPKTIHSPRPGVVALHSTVEFTIRQPSGLQGDEEDFFGLKLAQRGYVSFCPRCFLWQGPGTYLEHVAEFQKRHPKSKGMSKMLWDAVRGLDLLESLEEVDSKRLGAVGHSLGAKEVLYLAAFDERVKVSVSSEGGIGRTFSNWDASWYLGEPPSEQGFAREHHELLGMIAPRPFLLLGGDSADGKKSWPFIEAALPIYKLYGKPARLGLFNHRQGHSVPPEAEKRIYEWFDTYL